MHYYCMPIGSSAVCNIVGLKLCAQKDFNVYANLANSTQLGSPLWIEKKDVDRGPALCAANCANCGVE